MIEITLLRRESTAQNNGKPSVFQFENDELQAFLADAHATDAGCQVISVRALGVPLTVTGEAPSVAASKPPLAKTAGPGAPRTQAPGINTPIQEQARTAHTESREEWAKRPGAKESDAVKVHTPISAPKPEKK